MDAKPEWVPEWVWTEYTERRRWDNLQKDEYLTRIWQRIDKIISAPDCVSVWQALDTRKAAIDERDQRWSVTFGLPSIRFGGLLYEIASNADGATASELLSKSRRKALGTKVAKLARELSHAMRQTGMPEAFARRLRRPTEMPRELQADGEDMLRTIDIRAPRERQIAMLEMLASEEHRASLMDAYAAGRRDAVWHFGGTLEAIADAGEALAASKPPIAHTSSPDATRLFFIRETTALMRHHYGQPLREQVAALTRVLFNCEMDAATVTKLAP